MNDAEHLALDHQRRGDQRAQAAAREPRGEGNLGRLDIGFVQQLSAQAAAEAVLFHGNLRVLDDAHFPTEHRAAVAHAVDDEQRRFGLVDADAGEIDAERVLQAAQPPLREHGP